MSSLSVILSIYTEIYSINWNVNLKLFVQLHYVSELTLIPEDQEYHFRVLIRVRIWRIQIKMEC